MSPSCPPGSGTSVAEAHLKGMKEYGRSLSGGALFQRFNRLVTLAQPYTLQQFGGKAKRIPDLRGDS